MVEDKDKSADAGLLGLVEKVFDNFMNLHPRVSDLEFKVKIMWWVGGIAITLLVAKITKLL